MDGPKPKFSIELVPQGVLCRPITLEYVASGDVPGVGMNGSRFELTPNFFANESVNPDNACYAGAKEVRSGVLDIGLCKWGAPMYISQPHFYQGGNSTNFLDFFR